MSRKISEEDYKSYLRDLIDSVFKILPLYEEENEYLDDYMDSLLNFELYGAEEVMEGYPYKGWHNKTVSTIEGVRKQMEYISDPKEKDNHRRVKREILKTTSLIDKHLKRMEEEK